MIEMMLTGQKYSADDALSLRLAHYSVADGDAMELAQTLAGKMSRNALLTFVFKFQAILLINHMTSVGRIKMKLLLPISSGLVVSIGISVSGMMETTKVLNFLIRSDLGSNPRFCVGGCCGGEFLRV